MAKLTYKSGLPEFLGRKIYKTGQTRGAARDEIFQNRVVRNNTVLIPLSGWQGDLERFVDSFERGYIVIARPGEYFSDSPPEPRSDLPSNLILGQNLLLFYRTRQEWDAYNPKEFNWAFATSRTPPLQGQYIARVPDTTSEKDSRILEGFTGSGSGGVGAGIRVYEYASGVTLKQTRYQLAYLAWRTEGMLDLVRNEDVKEPTKYKEHVDKFCEENGLADTSRLETNRLIHNGTTICPLCLKPVAAAELVSRVRQAEGREVPDLTATSVNLFHVDELRSGVFNHRVYNLGWGHHHCNTVARDYGIEQILEWMASILRNNNYTVKKM